jgi:OOP family OmpA-OmpF porin
MTILRNIALTGVLAGGHLALSGCNAFTSFSEVEALNEAQAVGNPFTQALASEYRTFSNSQLDSTMDYPDALHFARKGLAAAAGDMVMPEPLADWNISKPHMDELGANRNRLVVAYDYGAREVAPAQSALAQAKFDCWIEQQEESWDDTNVPCKSEFMSAMNALEGLVQAPPAPAPAAAPMIADIDPAKPMAPENAVYLVFFNWDSSKLTSGANSVLDAVAQEVASNPPGQINLTGHADTSGARDYNRKLSSKRGNIVKSALVKRGVPANMISINSMGENELLVNTPDGVREPANRRVNISFE